MIERSNAVHVWRRKQSFKDTAGDCPNKDRDNRHLEQRRPLLWLSKATEHSMLPTYLPCAAWKTMLLVMHSRPNGWHSTGGDVCCLHDISCFTFDIDQHETNYSVIAWQIGVYEIETAGLTEYDCLFNTVILLTGVGAVYHFYEDVFKECHLWTAETFEEKITTAGLQTVSYN